MEPLSGVASGMAVVSLAIQLVESVDNIRKFVKNVKGVPAELERLAELLTRLAVVLQDVANMSEQQSFLQTQLESFPAAPPTIFACLKTCKKALEPLVELASKYQKTANDSTMEKLRKDIRMSIKTKDIAALESRIQHEINFLQTAIGTNTNNILVNVLPVLLRNQQNRVLLHQCQLQSLAVSSRSNDLNEPVQYEGETNPSKPRYFRRTTEVDTLLRMFGVRRRRTVRYIRNPQDQRSRKRSSSQESIVTEENEYTIDWKMLGRQIRWSYESAFGRILPCLRVNPIFVVFPFKLRKAILANDVRALQTMFHSGEAHPFSQESSGASLLHYAAIGNVPDVYRLLLEYGVKTDESSPVATPFHTALRWHGGSIDLFRLLISNYDLVEGSQILSKPFRRGWPLKYEPTLSWLWCQSKHFAFGKDLFDFRIVLLRILFISLVQEGHQLNHGVILRKWTNIVEREYLQEMQDGGLKLLESLWSFMCYDWSSMDSYTQGSRLLFLLSEFGIDVQSCITQELEALGQGIFLDPDNLVGERKIVFDRSEKDKWRLGWEWTYESSNCGDEMNVLLSEYEVLATTFFWQRWPFFPNLYGEDRPLTQMQQSRFKRRAAAKARKERARWGQKQSRSKMPGAWVF